MTDTKQLVPLLIVGAGMFLIGGVGGVYASRLPQVQKLTGQPTSSIGTFAPGQRTFVRGQGGPNAGFGGPGAPGGNTFRGAGALNVFGKISDIGDKTMTITMQDGSSKIVTLSDTTQFQTVSTVAKTTVKAGDTVRVIGPTNSDGSVTAQNIMVNPPLPSSSASGSPQAPTATPSPKVTQ